MKQQSFRVITPGGGRQVLTRKEFYFGKGRKYTRVFAGKLITMQTQGFEELLLKLKQMQESGKDISPIFQETIDFFKLNMQYKFDARQTPDEPPTRWRQLSPKYAKMKFKNLGTRLANLVYSGTLRNAVNGGAGWYEDIQPTSAEWGITGIPYAAIHQYGSGPVGKPKNIPARRYFLASGNKFPKAVLNYMVSRVDDHLTGAF